MVFILATDGRDEDGNDGFQPYQEYLERVRDAFPRSAYEIATYDWYFSCNDQRGPHDAWLETFELRESSTGRQGEIRTLSLLVRLLGCHHDRYIQLRYPKVFSYNLKLGDGDHGQRDWRYDELRLSERGHLMHEIEWCRLDATGSWLIEASDLQIEWFPNTIDGLMPA
jgi:hypothetical protein